MASFVILYLKCLIIAASTAHPPAFQHRYSRDLFTVSRPQYIQRSPDSLILGLALAAGGSKGPDTYTGVGVFSSGIRKLAMAKLPPLKQPAGFATGFFEQGLMSGAMTLLFVLAAVGYGIWIYGWTNAQVAELDR